MSTTSTANPTHPSYDSSTARVKEGAIAKEVRAHEHARHLVKERQEHAIAKERKRNATTVRVLELKVTRTHGPKLLRKQLSMESWDGEEPEEQERALRDAVPSTPMPALAAETEHAAGRERDAVPRESVSTFTKLTLGDAISRPRQLKARQLDFEVIPPIRAVIALDDVEADEPWEYITRACFNDGSAWKGKSYAQVAASAM